MRTSEYLPRTTKINAGDMLICVLIEKYPHLTHIQLKRIFGYTTRRLGNYGGKALYEKQRKSSSR